MAYIQRACMLQDRALLSLVAYPGASAVPLMTTQQATKPSGITGSGLVRRDQISSDQARPNKLIVVPSIHSPAQYPRSHPFESSISNRYPPSIDRSTILPSIQDNQITLSN